jgi:cation diffusion facilitator family transporter
MKAGSTRVLIIALAANLGIAVAKFVAAAITGSSAMLTEGVHSLVDSTNQLLLLYGQKRAKRPPDERYPHGYGRELYFWSFVVALLVFALGAGVSIYEGILHILEPEPAMSPIVAYIVLAAAFAMEAGSTFAAFKEFDSSRRGRTWWAAIKETKDSPTVIVLLENGAAMAGILIAAAGVALSQITGNPYFDGAASILIGVVLGFVAAFLAAESKGLLIGETADLELVEGLRTAARREGVIGFAEVIAVHNAPDQIIAAMSVDFDNRMSARDVERIVAEIEEEVQKKWPEVVRLYVHPIDDVSAMPEASLRLPGFGAKEEPSSFHP